MMTKVNKYVQNMYVFQTLFLVLFFVKVGA